jgi:hypothetical protein
LERAGPHIIKDPRLLVGERSPYAPHGMVPIQNTQVANNNSVQKNAQHHRKALESWDYSLA